MIERRLTLWRTKDFCRNLTYLLLWPHLASSRGTTMQPLHWCIIQALRKIVNGCWNFRRQGCNRNEVSFLSNQSYLSALKINCVSYIRVMRLLSHVIQTERAYWIFENSQGIFIKWIPFGVCNRLRNVIRPRMKRPIVFSQLRWRWDVLVKAQQDFYSAERLLSLRFQSFHAPNTVPPLSDPTAKECLQHYLCILGV